MGIESISGSDLCVSGSEAAGWAAASLWLAAHFGALDIRLLENALHFEKITTKVKYFILNLANHKEPIAF